MEVWEELKIDPRKGARRLVAEYAARLSGVARMLATDDRDAEELVFRTLERVCAKIGKYRPEGSFFAWMCAILRNFWKMDLRKRGIEMISSGAAEDLPEIPTATYRELLENAAVDRVRDALSRLSPALREVVALRYFEDMPLEEIARCLAIPEGTVKSRLHNAKAALFVILGGNGHGRK
ncbi:MAG: sigma-70 family RNA polymerase sigma factor [Kiritimatiellae bacterium]|nr:sigma-70 family RNA polymerase sigma factor [Kiritimatiellia bacterium]